MKVMISQPMRGKTDKKIEQMIAFGVNEIDIKEEDYNKLKQETKNLIKLNNIKVNIIKV